MLKKSILQYKTNFVKIIIATYLSFGGFLKELPEDYHELAYEFKAFARARKIKSPAQLMQVVMQYSGIDLVLRETAGNFTLLHERITDTAMLRQAQHK